MSKDKYSDYDSTPSNNTDVGGVGIVGSVNTISNVDNALRELMSHTANHFSRGTIASAATMDIGSRAEHFLSVTGNLTITALGTVKAGTIKTLHFEDVLTLTHNATSLILLNSRNITTASGDVAVFVSEGSGNWRCISYQPAAYARTGRTLIARTTYSSSGTHNFNPNTSLVRLIAQGGGGGGGGASGTGSGVGAGAGGAGGGYDERWLSAGWSASETVTVGGGGLNGDDAGGNGGTGGTSSIGTLCVATGGTGGAGGASRVSGDQRGSTPPGTGGVATGSGGTLVSAGPSRPGEYGKHAAIFATGNTGVSGAGGSSAMGIGGLERIEGTAGLAGQGFGSGGSGGCSNSSTGRAGGLGAAGIVIIEEFG